MVKRVVLWSSVAGLMAAGIAIFSFLTGSPSLPDFVQQDVEVPSAQLSLDFTDTRRQRVFVLPVPIAYGANNAFLADRVLVDYFGDDAGIFLLECQEDRRCGTRLVEPFSKFFLPRYSTLQGDQLIVFGERDDGDPLNDNSLGDPTKGAGAYLGDDTALVTFELVSVDFRARTMASAPAFFRGCIYNGIAGALDEASKLQSGEWRLVFSAGCRELFLGGTLGHVSLSNGMWADFVATGQFNDGGEFVVSKIDATSRRDR